MRIRSLWRATLRAAQDWWKDNCLRLAASLAYYTALSLAPLLLLIVGLLGVVLGRAQVASQLEVQLEGLMGPAGRTAGLARARRVPHARPRGDAHGGAPAHGRGR
jgi:membrane protein